MSNMGVNAVTYADHVTVREKFHGLLRNIHQKAEMVLGLDGSVCL